MTTARNPLVQKLANLRSTVLEEGRYTWRHNSVLLKLLKGLKRMLQPVDKLYGDLPGYWANESPRATIPPELLYVPLHALISSLSLLKR